MKNILYIVCFLLLNGCYDRAYGPTVYNMLNTPLNIKITYTNTKIKKRTISRCQRSFLGTIDSVIKEVDITKNGEIIYHLNKEQAQQMLDVDTNFGWKVGESSIHPISRKDWDACRIDAELRYEEHKAKLRQEK